MVLAMTIRTKHIALGYLGLDSFDTESTNVTDMAFFLVGVPMVKIETR